MGLSQIQVAEFTLGYNTWVALLCSSASNMMSRPVIYRYSWRTFMLSSLPSLDSWVSSERVHLRWQQSLHRLVTWQQSHSMSVWSQRSSSPSNVSVTLASHCFHQNLVLWHEAAAGWWLRAEYLSQGERGRGRLIIVMVMTRLGFLEERASFGNRTGLLGPGPRCLGNTGNRKLPPIHFLIGWKGLQKNCVFSCMATG